MIPPGLSSKVEEVWYTMLPISTTEAGAPKRAALHLTKYRDGAYRDTNSHKTNMAFKTTYRQRCHEATRSIIASISPT